MDLKFSIFFICLVNTLIIHSLLTRKKTIFFCTVVFALNTIIVFYAVDYTRNPEIIKFLAYFITFTNIVYIWLVFGESIPKKIFALFSILMFSIICQAFSVLFTQFLLEIFDVKIEDLISIFRICIQVLLVLAAYLYISKPYKIILNIVSDKAISFMSLYPIVAFILLINNDIIIFQCSGSPMWYMLLFLVFIILGYVFLFAGISSASQIISMQYNMEKLEWASTTDPLTGLYNRRYIMEKIGKLIVGYKRFSLIIADIDCFKGINDTFGHDCGDRVLKIVSKSLQDAVREQDVVSRWGGEEFLLLLPETEIEGAHILADRIRKIIEEQIIVYNGVQMAITMTFGVTVNEDYERIEDTMKKADNALYEGKSRGRNCVIQA